MDSLRVFIRWCDFSDVVPPDFSRKIISPNISEVDDSKDGKLDAEGAEGILGYLSMEEYASERHVLASHVAWTAATKSCETT